jgi:DNA mismatch repair protein MutS
MDALITDPSKEGQTTSKKTTPKKPSSIASSKSKNTTKKARKLAPMLQQYVDMKAERPEHVLLFQVGDFYEVFFDDAQIFAETLGIRLTSRDKDQDNPIPMAGVPIHALDTYLPKLLSAGFSCVIVSQVEDPKQAKGMVRRAITRIITPGIRYEGDGLEEKRFNYLAAALMSQGDLGAVSYIDVSTGALRVQETETVEEFLEVVRRIEPAELILPSTIADTSLDKRCSWVQAVKAIADEFDTKVIWRPFEHITSSNLEERVTGMLPVTGAEELREALPSQIIDLGIESRSAVSCVMEYVEEVSFGSTPKLSQFLVEERSTRVFIDAATRRNLELTEARIDGERKNSLLYHIDHTKTAMGSRLLSDWVLIPSADIDTIVGRHDAVEELLQRPSIGEELRDLFAGVRDIDRLLSRVTGLRASPRDLRVIAESVSCLPRISEILSEQESDLLSQMAQQLDVLDDVRETLLGAIVEDAPVKVSDGGIFQEGFNEEVDRLRKLRTEGNAWLASFEAREKEKTGITGLRVKYNNVFGYFIEVTKANLSKIPDYFERKQTLVNAERFITEELKTHEVELLSAKARQLELERELFAELRTWLSSQAGRIMGVSRLLSQLDVITALAHLAAKHNYSRPRIGTGLDMKIEGGRHPVVENVIGAHNFVPNDTLLNTDGRMVAVLTGPNMGGKSTYLRQVGLIQLLAQAGSFVPAERAELSLVDRIFTRIGAADDLTRGDSTFMVEMREAATIARRATPHSLVLIDEIGRGTATSDGLALATAILEWLHDSIGCKTLFATHFHELTELAMHKKNGFCIAVGVLEREKELHFTHRIEEKVVLRSFGLEVARLAGLPDALVMRAEQVLEALRSEEHARVQVVSGGGIVDAQPVKSVPKSLNDESAVSELREELRILRDSHDSLRQRINSFQPETMRPIDALVELGSLKDSLN